MKAEIYVLDLRRQAHGQPPTYRTLEQHTREGQARGHLDEHGQLTDAGYAALLSGSCRDKLRRGGLREAFGNSSGAGFALARTEVIMLADIGLLVRGPRGAHQLTERGERVVALLRAEEKNRAVQP